jgi:hypothetical protein
MHAMQPDCNVRCGIFYTVVIQIPKIELQKTGLPRGGDPLFLFLFLLLLLLLFFIVAIVRIAALVAIVAVF